jgi:hypothetical protein
MPSANKTVASVLQVSEQVAQARSVRIRLRDLERRPRNHPSLVVVQLIRHLRLEGVCFFTSETKLGTGSGTTTPTTQKTFGTFGGPTAFGGSSAAAPSTTPASTTAFGFGAKPAEITTPAAKTGFGFGGGASTTPFGAPQQPTDKPAETKPAFGGFATQPTEQKTGFGGFGQASTSATSQPSVSGFGFGQQSTQQTTDKPAEPNPAFGGFRQPSTLQTTTDKAADSKPAFGGFGQSIQQISTDRPAEKPVDKPTFGGFSAATKSSPWATPSTSTGTGSDKPAENKGFELGAFASAPASVSTTPKPPENTTATPATGAFGFKPTSTSISSTAPSEFAGFNTTTPATTPATATPTPATATPTPATDAAGAFGLKPFTLGGGGTTGSSTAATSVSGDSTDTTPAPIKKDFAGFSGFTPSTTPAPDKQEKKEEKKTGFGFAGFGAKKDESLEKKDEKPIGFGGFGAPTTTTPAAGDKGMSVGSVDCSGG